MNGFAVVRGSRVSVDRCFAVGNTYDAYHIVDGSFLRWSGSTAYGSGITGMAGSNSSNTGVRVETASVAILDGGGISGASMGVCGGHRSNIVETLDFNQVLIPFDNDSNSTVDSDTTGLFT
jgi:hypothetical protein